MPTYEEQDFFDVPKMNYLTPEQVRSYPQFVNATDEEVENIIQTLYDLGQITSGIISRELKSPEPEADCGKE
jgi:galactose-1-phosphate uridylyltransferase